MVEEVFLSEVSLTRKKNLKVSMNTTIDGIGIRYAGGHMFGEILVQDDDTIVMQSTMYFESY